MTRRSLLLAAAGAVLMATCLAVACRPDVPAGESEPTVAIDLTPIVAPDEDGAIGRDGSPSTGTDDDGAGARAEAPADNSPLAAGDSEPNAATTESGLDKGLPADAASGAGTGATNSGQAVAGSLGSREGYPALPGSRAAPAESALGAAMLVLPSDGDSLPADMLTPEEAERATAAALESTQTVVGAANRDGVRAADVSTLADQPNYRVMYTQRAPLKDGQDRTAEVAVFRYDTNETEINHVNLATGAITSIDLPAGYKPPMLPREIQEAALVAKRDATVRAALEDAGLDPDIASANALLTGTSAGDDGPCATHRCLKLFFFDDQHLVPTFTTIVDISALRVVEVSPFETDAGGS